METSAGILGHVYGGQWYCNVVSDYVKIAI